MYRNQYDNDVSTFSPQGRIHQIEYAMEAVKQGSATVGLKSANHAVLASLMRAPNDLSSYQKKIMQVDDHVGVSIAGLLGDAKILLQYMRTQCLEHKYRFGEPLPVNRLVVKVSDRSQPPTQRYGSRPYGVGFLVAGYDHNGPKIYQTCPSACFYDCKAMAIGARSQPARTYLERHLDEFPLVTEGNELIRHALLSLKETLPAEMSLSTRNCSVAIVGKDQDLKLYEGDAVRELLDLIADEPGQQAAVPEGGGGGAGTPADVPMD